MNLFSLVVAAAVLASPLAASAEPLQHELLVFGSAELARTSGAELPVAHFDRERIAADILFSVQQGPLKVFGEYLLTNHEADLERFQVGWEPTDRSIIWLGRFHQASSVWNHEHHHGQFLQTSITRPAVEEWEDEGGIIPQHFVGLLSESNWHLGKRRELRTALGGGIAPVITPEGLEPFDLLEPDLKRHKAGFQARVAYLPDELEDTGFGILFAHNEIAWRGPQLAVEPFDHIDQTVTGVYANVEANRWKVQAAAYRVQAEFGEHGGPATRNDFLVGYVQVEHALPRGIDLFLRHEDSADTESSGYLRLFPHFVTWRTSVGARWQFAREHALTLQLGNSHTMQEKYREFRLQWSAALL